MKGYTGRILFINLSEGSVKEERLPEKTYRDFIGGYGLTAKVFYDRMKPKVDPLGPDNMLGFMAGTLNGVPVSLGARSTVAAKSPLTNTIGECTVGGHLGAELKASGFDGLFFTGISPKPVYLWLSNGKAELKDATDLWGKDTYETEDFLRKKTGDVGVRVACIGPAGEAMSLIASVMHDKGRAAGRSGLGAVMGSKRLKAIAVRGQQEVEVANGTGLKILRQKINKDIKESLDMRWARETGTCGNLSTDLVAGCTPIKNWRLGGEQGFPNHAKLDGPNVMKYLVRKYACAHCAVACGGYLTVNTGPFQVIETKKPEYETIGSFGPNCYNENVESVIKANDICDRYGIDTISAGATIAFAMECYERGVINKNETEGIELTWGNAEAIIALLEKMVKREGIGKVFADGTAKAVDRIGKNSHQWAVHFHGQEPGCFDPRAQPARAIFYAYDPSPGRHTSGTFATYCERLGNYLGTYPELDVPKVNLRDYQNKNKGVIYTIGSSYHRLLNASGACLFMMELHNYPLIELISAVTGWDFTPTEGITVGRRIQTLRQMFNIRDGFTAKDFQIPERFKQPVPTGPAAGEVVDYDILRRSYFETIGWDPETGIPTPQTLRELGLIY